MHAIPCVVCMCVCCECVCVVSVCEHSYYTRQLPKILMVSGFAYTLSLTHIHTVQTHTHISLPSLVEGPICNYKWLRPRSGYSDSGLCDVEHITVFGLVS